MAIPLETRAAMQKEFTSRMSKIGDRFIAEVSKFDTFTMSLAAIFNEVRPTQTPAAQVVRVGKGAKEMASKVEAVKANIDRIFGEEMAAILKRKLEKVPLVITDTAYAKEIRDRVSVMSNGDITDLLMTLASTNKANELAAITQVSPILSGVTGADQARFRAMIFELHAPTELADERALMADYDTAIQAYNVAKATAGDYSNARTIASIMDAENRAENADSALAQAMAS